MHFQKYPFGTYSGCLSVWKWVLVCLSVYMEITHDQALFKSNCNLACKISDPVMYHWLLYGAAPLISLLSGLHIGTCISLCLAAVHPAHSIPPACIQKLCLLLTADSSLLLTQQSKLCEFEAYQIEGNWEPKAQIEINVRFAHMCTKTVPPHKQPLTNLFW